MTKQTLIHHLSLPWKKYQPQIITKIETTNAFILIYCCRLWGLILESWECCGATDICGKVNVGKKFRVGEDLKVRYLKFKTMMDYVNMNAF